MTRSSPKSFCRPSVTRKTPPSLPMSSPMRRTLGSSSMARAQAGVDALGDGQLASSVRSPRSWRGRRRTRRAPPRRAGAPRRRRGRTSTAARGRASPGSPRGPARPARRPRASTASKNAWSAMPLRGQVGLEPRDRVPQLPRLDLGRDAVAGRVVGGRVRAHPVGEGLDERRALAGRGRASQRRLGDGVDGEDVVAVDPDAGEAEAAARAGRAGCGSAARSARRWPTGCSGRRTRPGAL